MICKQCEGIVVLHAFSHGNCKICDKEIDTPHIPCYEVCKKCSETQNICEQCGKPLNDDKGKKESRNTSV